MAVLQSYQQLRVWQAARTLVKDIYELCNSLPISEKFGLASQLKRASVSIPSNIAEGYRRGSRKEYIRFLSIAAGSAAEVETQLILISDLFKIDTGVQIHKINEVQKMLTSLVQKLRPIP